MKTRFKPIQKRNPVKPEDPQKFYVQVVPKDTYTIKEVANSIAGMSSLSVMDVQAVLLGFIEVFPEILQHGNRIKLDGLGVFSLGVHSEGADSEDDLTAFNIKKVRLRFAPDKQFKKALQMTEFEKVD